MAHIRLAHRVDRSTSTSLVIRAIDHAMALAACTRSSIWLRPLWRDFRRARHLAASGSASPSSIPAFDGQSQDIHPACDGDHWLECIHGNLLGLMPQRTLATPQPEKPRQWHSPWIVLDSPSGSTFRLPRERDYETQPFLLSHSREMTAVLSTRLQPTCDRTIDETTGRSSGRISQSQESKH